MSYAVIENTPGYLPESEPEVYNDRTEAEQAAEELAAQMVEEGWVTTGRHHAPDGRLALIHLRNPDVPQGRVVEIQETEGEV